jgi:hypothetical protein
MKKMGADQAGKETLQAGAGADADLLAIFARDARKALPILEATFKDIDVASDDDLRLFTTNVHAMKAALANIGEAEAADLAGALEKAGKDKNKTAIRAESQNFIDVLAAITAKAEAEAETNEPDVEGDLTYLNGQLKIIEAACAEYDDMKAKDTLANIRAMPWKKETKAVLDKIDEYLLHSDFENAESEAACYLSIHF